jgi:hypothetical protein
MSIPATLKRRRKTPPIIEPKIMIICAKCSDMFSATILDKSRKVIGDYDGYVPEFFPGEHYGDYVMLEIDLETGQILNWKKPSYNQIENMLEKKE